MEHSLQGSPVAPRLARDAVAECEALAPYPDLSFTAQLLSSELIANAVRHARQEPGERVSLLVECDDEVLRVEVRDGGPGVDPLALLVEHAQEDERHRGLFLVHALADRWGFRRAEGSYLVWFELDLLPGRRPWRGREPVPGASV